MCILNRVESMVPMRGVLCTVEYIWALLDGISRHVLRAILERLRRLNMKRFASYIVDGILRCMISDEIRWVRILIAGSSTGRVAVLMSLRVNA